MARDTPQESSLDPRTLDDHTPATSGLADGSAVDDTGAGIEFATTRVEDVSARREAEETLREARDSLEHEIAERKLADLELQRHREHLSDLVALRTAELEQSRSAFVEAQAVAHVGSWEWDITADHVWGSDEFYRLFDVEPDRISTLAQFIARLHPDDQERVQASVADAIRLDIPYDTDYRVALGDGGWRDINARGRVFTNDDGVLARMVGTCLDITERKRAETELLIKNVVFEHSVASQSVADRDGTITHVNQAFVDLWGYPDKATAVGNSVGSFFADPADAGPVLSAIAERDAWEGEFMAQRADGSTFISRGMATSLRDKNGELIGYQSTNLDVTREREAVTALAQSERQYRELIEHLPTGLVVHAPDTTIRLSNPKASELLGLSEDQLHGRAAMHPDWSFLRHDGSILPLDEYPVNAVLAAGRPLQHEVAGINRPATGDVAWVLVNAFADVDDEGRVTQVVVAFADMTDLKRAEAQLQDTLEELKRSNRDLEQFAYVASHDLQEPLRMVASYTQLLAERYEGQLDEKADRFIHYAVDGATRMQGLVNDLLAYSRVGTRGGPRETVQSGEVVAEVVQSLGQAIAQSGAEVVVDRLPTVTTDRTQLGQVFQNLIGNAIRFHGDAPPRVDIAARLAGDFWEFCVADNGVGIDPQFHERIFVIFQRLHEWGRYPGSGIGLAIVKRIVERQGGRVWVESTAGNGARFCFTLPADDRGRLDA